MSKPFPKNRTRPNKTSQKTLPRSELTFEERLSIPITEDNHPSSRLGYNDLRVNEIHIVNQKPVVSPSFDVQEKPPHKLVANIFVLVPLTLETGFPLLNLSFPSITQVQTKLLRNTTLPLGGGSPRRRDHKRTGYQMGLRTGNERKGNRDNYRGNQVYGDGKSWQDEAYISPSIATTAINATTAFPDQFSMAAPPTFFVQGPNEMARQQLLFMRILIGQQ
ncbi:hypothetical protein V6N12_074302 [Hibiscus sabdariffa]|uniref:Uncharacterized protein n=1 Tax=Hibiscus sabdariffa TaxID=183260 RepID=A0ABR2BKR9_9ROSI